MKSVLEATDMVMCSIIENCPKLRIINCEHLEKLTDETLFACAKFGRLQKEVLNFKNCKNITDEGVKALSSLPNIASLLVGTDVEPNSISGASIIPLLRATTNSLIYLNIDNSRITGEIWKVLGETGVTKLSMKWCNQVDESEVVEARKKYSEKNILW
eukprot:TRINITY_DN213_c0_g1_i2.p2 TRINITY_DN213_c0_g1~~TRINITY_DN213_c0_g1_i2.p2  ORF type:complete len:158 (+),score=26.00 TRINITY_DN213_c0_g1_i2:1042-1515(+)